MERAGTATELQWTLSFKQDHFLNPETYPVTKVVSQGTPLLKISKLSYLPAYTFLSKTCHICEGGNLCQ